MSSEINLSLLEQYVLMAIINLHPSAYGVTIQEEIVKTAEKKFSLGSIYSALERLKESKFVSMKQGEATSVRGGRRKLYFTITADGQAALRASMNALDAMRASMPTWGIA